MLSVIIPRVIMLSVMLSVIMLSVVMLSVASPFEYLLTFLVTFEVAVFLFLPFNHE
jgi:hypothetical protein